MAGGVLIDAFVEGERLQRLLGRDAEPDKLRPEAP
jgi:hypothetical protein